MATRTEVVLLDDLTGKADDDVQTVAFALSGAAYEIDLNPGNREQLHEALEPYLAAARPTGNAARIGARPPRPSEASPAQAVRTWARAQDLPVPPRGRIPKPLLEQWRAAGSPR